jgi:hypothetical protein
MTFLRSVVHFCHNEKATIFDQDDIRFQLKRVRCSFPTIWELRDEKRVCRELSKAALDLSRVKVDFPLSCGRRLDSCIRWHNTSAQKPSSVTL